MSSDLVTLVRADLQKQVDHLTNDVQNLHTVTEQAGFADGIPAYTVATLPTLGLGNGTTFITLAFASNGRKSGEGAGLGTGVPVYWNAVSSQWLKFSDDTVVTS